MPSFFTRLSILLAALWWGSLSGLGFVVVPLLFRHLPSPAVAGATAAQLFAAQTWLSVGCAVLLLLVSNRRDGVSRTPAQQLGQAQVQAWAVLGLLLALLVEFGVAQQIVSARASGGNLRLWHGLGSALYVGQWFCACRVLWCVSCPDAAPTKTPNT